VGLKISGAPAKERQAQLIELKSDQLSVKNAPEMPEAITPQQRTLTFKDNEPELYLDALSFWVLRIKR
jgi:hypothetical protein